MGIKTYINSTKKTTVVCVLRSGGDFIPYHVEVLAQQVEQNTTVDYEFVCLTDCQIDIPGIKVIPLLNNWPGWWSCIELYRIVGKVLALDIDTVVLDSIDDLIESVSGINQDQFYMLKSFRLPERGTSGIVAYNGDWSYLYKDFNYKAHSRKYRGDENYINAKLERKPEYIQSLFPGIYSYKRHCHLGIPQDCSILVFHGNPRPFNVPEVWDKIAEVHA